MSVWWDNLRENNLLAIDPEARKSLDAVAITYTPMYIFSTLLELLRNEKLNHDQEVQLWIITTLATYKNGQLQEFVKPEMDFVSKDKELVGMRNTLWQMLI